MGFVPNSANVRREGYSPALIQRFFGGTNGSTQTATQTLTIPQVNSPLDYIVVMTNNSTSITGATPSELNPNYLYTQAVSTGSTYWEVATTFVFQANSTSATGQQITLGGGGYAFNWHIMTFTNPYKTRMELYQGNGFFGLKATKNSVTTANASSLAETAWTSTPMPPVTKIRNISANGSTGSPNVSFSGSGTSYYNQDSYWWRSCAVNVTTDALVASTGTVSMNNCAVAMATITLI